MVGIGITTYNRPEVFAKTLREIKRYLPNGAKLVIVDDCSTIPCPDATHRFETNKGAATAKNKCFELLQDCEHIFLFDDDTYPIVNGWELPYINSGYAHLNYTFKYHKADINGIMVCDNPNGCMMYFRQEVLKVVGGFDTTFGKYGYWHGSMSCRIYNAGLTPFPFMDVPNSDSLFYSGDREGSVKTSRPDRQQYLKDAKAKYHADLGSSKYIEFRSEAKPIKVWYSNPYSTEKNIGKALNEFCANVPDGDWICLQDGDIIYLTPDWGVQIEEVIRKHGSEFGLIGCLTNRLGRDVQRYQGEFSNEHDIKVHFELAKYIAKSDWAVVEDVTRKKYIAGMLMLFPKSLWNKIKFKENTPAFDDYFSKEVIKNGYKLGLMKGLYVYHLYRIWSDTPSKDRGHLF